MFAQRVQTIEATIPRLQSKVPYDANAVSFASSGSSTVLLENHSETGATAIDTKTALEAGPRGSEM